MKKRHKRDTKYTLETQAWLSTISWSLVIGFLFLQTPIQLQLKRKRRKGQDRTTLICTLQHYSLGEINIIAWLANKAIELA